MVKQPIIPRDTEYGETKKSGGILFMESTNNNQDLHIVVQLASHEIQSIDSVYFGEDELTHPSGCQDIKIIPVATGSRDFFESTFGKFVMAAAFIAAPYLAPGLAGVSIGAGAAATTLGAISTSIGISFALSGASQLLFPPPAPPNIASINNPSNQNFAFSGIQQVSRVGTALPLAFGQVFCGSIVVSAGVDTVQVEGQA